MIRKVEVYVLCCNLTKSREATWKGGRVNPSFVTHCDHQSQFSEVPGGGVLAHAIHLLFLASLNNVIFCIGICIYIFVILISREKMNLVDGSNPCVFIFIHAEYFTSTISSLVNLTQIGQYFQ